MKTTFQRLHRTAFIAFPLTTVLLLLNLSLFGELSTVMLVIWGISIGLLAVVLLATAAFGRGSGSRCSCGMRSLPQLPLLSSRSSTSLPIRPCGLPMPGRRWASGF